MKEIPARWSFSSVFPTIRIGQGKIRQSVGIDNALQVLQRFADFEYEKDEQNNTITIR